MSPSDEPTGLKLVDEIGATARPSIEEYAAAASDYIRSERDLSPGPKKRAQVRLSDALARAVAADLQERNPSIHAEAGERTVAGGLRPTKLDVVEQHSLDGLRLAIEIKPVHLAVGRAIWNRFGDIRTIAVNLHLKFPFAVVGGLLTVPTYERTRAGRKKSTLAVVTRVIERLDRAGDRRTEANAPHLMEAVGLVVFDPDTGAIDSSLLHSESKLRYERFVAALAAAYGARFED